MKRGKSILFLCLGLFVILLLYLPFFSGDVIDSASGLGEGNGQDLVDKMDPSNWNNLTGNWKAKLLNNNFISGMDNFFTKINPVFFVLTGENYSFSLFFFFVIVLLFWFFLNFNRILKMASIFSKWVGMLISFGLAIALGQLGLYALISNFFVHLIFLPKKSWLGIVIFVGIILGLIFLSKLSNSMVFMSKKGKEKFDKEMEKYNRDILDVTVKGIEKGFNNQ
jgi:hypothetical protein